MMAHTLFLFTTISPTPRAVPLNIDTFEEEYKLKLKSFMPKSVTDNMFRLERECSEI